MKVPKVRWNPKSAVKGPKVRWFAGESPKSAVEVPKVRWNSEKIIFIGEVLEFSRWIWKILGKTVNFRFPRARTRVFHARTRAELWFVSAHTGYSVFPRGFWCLHGRAHGFSGVYTGARKRFGRLGKCGKLEKIREKAWIFEKINKNNIK